MDIILAIVEVQQALDYDFDVAIFSHWRSAQYQVKFTVDIERWSDADVQEVYFFSNAIDFLGYVTISQSLVIDT